MRIHGLPCNPAQRLADFSDRLVTNRYHRQALTFLAINIGWSNGVQE